MIVTLAVHHVVVRDEAGGGFVNRRIGGIRFLVGAQQPVQRGRATETVNAAKVLIARNLGVEHSLVHDSAPQQITSRITAHALVDAPGVWRADGTGRAHTALD